MTEFLLQIKVYFINNNNIFPNELKLTLVWRDTVVGIKAVILRHSKLEGVEYSTKFNILSWTPLFDQ
jgi:hypothetical protein